MPDNLKLQKETLSRLINKNQKYFDDLKFEEDARSSAVINISQNDKTFLPFTCYL